MKAETLFSVEKRLSAWPAVVMKLASTTRARSERNSTLILRNSGSTQTCATRGRLEARLASASVSVVMRLACDKTIACGSKLRTASRNRALATPRPARDDLRSVPARATSRSLKNHTLWPLRVKPFASLRSTL